MLTIPIIGWVAKLGPSRRGPGELSRQQIRPQRVPIPYGPTRNGVSLATGLNITPTIQTDANLTADTNFSGGLGAAFDESVGHCDHGGLLYIHHGHEWSLWDCIRRDVLSGRRDDYRGTHRLFAIRNYGQRHDPERTGRRPEEWGWPRLSLQRLRFNNGLV